MAGGLWTKGDQRTTVKKNEHFFDLKTKKWVTLGSLNVGRSDAGNKLVVIKVTYN